MSERGRFNSVYERIDTIRRAVEKLGWHYVNSTHLTKNKGDWYLYKVISQDAEKENYQVHTFNSQDGGMYCGHYCLTEAQAKNMDRWLARTDYGYWD